MLLVIYLLSYDLRHLTFRLGHVLCQGNWNCNIKITKSFFFSQSVCFDMVVHFEKKSMFSIMLVIFFYSILTSVAKSVFRNNLKDGEMITSCLMFERTTL